jgi:hypothetical protein
MQQRNVFQEAIAARARAQGLPGDVRNMNQVGRAQYRVGFWGDDMLGLGLNLGF